MAKTILAIVGRNMLYFVIAFIIFGFIYNTTNRGLGVITEIQQVISPDTYLKVK